MRVPFITRQIAIGVMLLPIYVQAMDCSDAQTYVVNNDDPIMAGEVYRHNDAAYECTTPSWCSGPSWAYAPGSGVDWEGAWKLLGQCSDPKNDPPEILHGITIREQNAGLHRSLPTEEKFLVNVPYYLGSYILDFDSNLVSWALSVEKPDGSIETLESDEFFPQVNAGVFAEFTPEVSGTYTLILVATDEFGEMDEGAFPVEVVSQPPVTITCPDVVYVGERTFLHATSWQADSLPNPPSVEFSHPVNNAHLSPSAGAWPTDTGFVSQIKVNWTPLQVGEYTATATFGGNTAEAITEVLPADGIPVIRHRMYDSLLFGRRISFLITALDKDEMSELIVYHNGAALEPYSKKERLRGDIPWGMENWYSVDVFGDANIVINAIDNEGNLRVVEHVIRAIGSECQLANVDLQDVSEYPEWTQVDWKGDPSHAVQGDLMSVENVVYRAKWWTQAIPGSSNAWEKVCEM